MDRGVRGAFRSWLRPVLKVSYFIEKTKVLERIHLSGLKQGIHHGEASDVEVEVDLVERLAATIGGLRK